MNIDTNIENFILDKLIELGVRAEVIAYILKMDIEVVNELIASRYVSVHAILNKLETYIEDSAEVEIKDNTLDSIGLDFIKKEIGKLHLYFENFN